MAVEDYLEPEIGVAVALTAAVTSPKVRGVLRRGAVYGLAGVLMAGDAVSSLARGIKRGAQQDSVPGTADTVAADGVAARPRAAERASKPGEPSAAEAPDAAAAEAVETPHRRARKPAEAAANE